MPTSPLKTALTTANLSTEEFAEIIGVDPKTVGRWVTGTTIPYPRHRAKISRALDLPEYELWPDQAAPPATDPDRHGVGRHEFEVTGAWAYPTDENAPDLLALIEATDGPVDLTENGRGIELGKPMVDLLIAQAGDGRHIRLLTTLPNPKRITPLITQPNIEVRVGGSSYYAISRTGDTVLFAINLDYDGYDPPLLLQLDHATDGGIFDRLTDNYQALWDGADETFTDPEQLNAYADEDDEEADLIQTDLNGASNQTERPSPPTPSDIKQAARRWPRRPT